MGRTSGSRQAVSFCAKSRSGMTLPRPVALCQVPARRFDAPSRGARSARILGVRQSRVAAGRPQLCRRSVQATSVYQMIHAASANRVTAAQNQARSASSVMGPPFELTGIIHRARPHALRTRKVHGRARSALPERKAPPGTMVAGLLWGWNRRGALPHVVTLAAERGLIGAVAGWFSGYDWSGTARQSTSAARAWPPARLHATAAGRGATKRIAGPSGKERNDQHGHADCRRYRQQHHLLINLAHRHAPASTAGRRVGSLIAVKLLF
jgi:hypothetical protein